VEEKLSSLFGAESALLNIVPKIEQHLNRRLVLVDTVVSIYVCAQLNTVSDNLLTPLDESLLHVFPRRIFHDCPESVLNTAPSNTDSGLWVLNALAFGCLAMIAS